MKAWGAIPSAMIEYIFKKCGISNNFDGTDDNIMFKDVCWCAWPRSAMPKPRNQTDTWDDAAMLVLVLRQRR